MTRRSPTELIDRERYPIDVPDSAEYRAMAERCRAQLADHDACVLPGFLRPAAIEAVLAEIRPLLGEAYYCAHDHNPYLAEPDPRYDAAHPRNRLEVSDLGCLADDQLPTHCVLRALYDWPALRRFLAAVLGKAQLHPYADPLGSLNVNVAREGQQLGWHFDNADFAITLLLQAAEAGGVYEYLPRIRTAEDNAFEAVGRTLDGDTAGVRRLSTPPGTLVLFQGRASLHRVTPVEGQTPRLIAVLSYDPEPGVMLSEHNRRLFYGRVA
jgi:hypothetical protein